MRRPAGRFSTLFTLFIAGACVGCNVRPGNEPRPVLLITVDGLVASDVSAFGGDIPTPRLRAFADRGLAWPTALTAVPMTRPAVATYLTGLAPDRHGVRDDLFAVLPEDIPTLAESFEQRGYVTAAFLDSSFLSEDSGLWRGFGLVDQPPPAPRTLARWFPRVRTDDDHGVTSARWLETLDGGTAWFAWVHLAYPLRGQLQEALNVDAKTIEDHDGWEAETALRAVELDPERTYEASLQVFDRQLGEILDAVEARDDDALVVLVGTLADVRGDAERQIPMGPGFSLDDTRVHVPLVILAPGSPEAVVERRRPWGPDVARSIAAWAGFDLDPRAEGEDLLAPGDPGRIVFSWSWAPLDQFGWHRLALADDGERRVVMDGLRPIDASPDSADLERAISSRREPVRRELPWDLVQPLLARHQVQPDPIDPAGNDLEDPEARRLIAGRIWVGRSLFARNDQRAAGNLITPVSQRLDPTNVAGWLDRGQMAAIARRSDAASRIFKKTLALRPQDADTWHWLAHVLLRTDLAAAEEILTAIQPHLTDQADVLYDLACTRSLAEDVDGSAGYLARAWEAGFRKKDLIEADADLRYLRESGKLSEFLRTVQ